MNDVIDECNGALLYLLNIFIFYGYIIFFFAHMGCLFQFMIHHYENPFNYFVINYCSVFLTHPLLNSSSNILFTIQVMLK